MIFGLFNQLQSNIGHVWHYMTVINENKTVQTQVRLIKWWVNKYTLAFEKNKINIKSQLVLGLSQSTKGDTKWIAGKKQ